jgi:hypothetical protein
MPPGCSNIAFSNNDPVLSVLTEFTPIPVTGGDVGSSSSITKNPAQENNSQSNSSAHIATTFLQELVTALEVNLNPASSRVHVEGVNKKQNEKQAPQPARKGKRSKANKKNSKKNAIGPSM